MCSLKIILLLLLMFSSHKKDLIDVWWMIDMIDMMMYFKMRIVDRALHERESDSDGVM